MKSHIKGIINQVRELADPIVDDLGYELIDVEYVFSNGKWVLRLYIDKQGGVSIDDCVRVSRELDVYLDVHDIIPHEYVFEVSSPGVNRILRREKDFSSVIGKRIKVRVDEAIEGRRNFTGTLVDVLDGKLKMNVDGIDFEIPLERIEKANLIYEFERG